MVTPKKTSWLLRFAMVNTLLMTGISIFINLEPASLWSWLFRICGLLIYFGFISCLLALLIKLVASLYEPVKKPLAVILFSATQIIIVANVQIHSLYHFHINGMVLNLLFSGALLETIAFSWWMWICISLIMLLVVFTEYSLLLWIEKKSGINSSQKTQLVLFSLLFISFILLNGFAEGLRWNWVNSQRSYIPWLPTISMRSHLKRMGFDVQKHSPALSAKSSAIHYPLETLNCTDQHPMNILFLIVDSLRADMMTAEIMPFSNSLRAKSLDFINHSSNANSTRYGMFTLFYGLNGSYWHPMLQAERGSVLFDISREKKYQHFIYGSTKLTFPEFDRTIFSSLRDQLQKGEQKNSADNDREITDRFLQGISDRDTNRPFLGFLFFDSPHAFSLPHHYPEIFSPRLDKVNYLALNDDYNPLPFLNLYKTTAHYVDTQIQRVIEKLDQQQLTNNTLIIITSDHGQEFNETGLNYWGHNGNFSRWQTHVPFIALWPGKSAQVYSHLSSHEDLIPTLMQDIFHCKNDISRYSTGQSLFNTLNKNRSLLMETWTERAIYYNNTLYFMDALGVGKTVDTNYRKIDAEELPPSVLHDNIEKISRFLKH